MTSAVILPHTFVALRLPSGQHKVLKIVPDTSVNLGKFGSFATNALLGRPYYLTYEVADGGDGKPATQLRVVPAAELHAAHLLEEEAAPQSSDVHSQVVTPGRDGAPAVDIDGAAGEATPRTNRLTVDDPTRQTLSMEEIEQMKKASVGSGSDIVAKILQSHSALAEKTSFSLAKYTLRKHKKYVKRFTALPLDVSMLAKWILEEKGASRVMEIREEILGLLASWSNVHYRGLQPGIEHLSPSGRVLVVDDTGGLIVAALAERMGLLHPLEPSADDREAAESEIVPTDLPKSEDQTPSNHDTRNQHRKPKKYPPDAMSAADNTITVVHPAAQANISMLAYFAYNPTDTSSKSTALLASDHPLHTHLKTISFLQVVDPSLDSSYAEPEILGEEALAALKSSQRGNYHRKRRRWASARRVVDEVRAGGYDGLVVATAMAPSGVLRHLVPLLRGGAPVVVYSPYVEPLAELADCYSSSRKTAFLNALAGDGGYDSRLEALVPSDDFPLDPRLLLAPSLQTARATAWQVLPGRTHPLMTSRGGAEGYLFTATRVLPAGGRVEARGRFAKKRKQVGGGEGVVATLTTDALAAAESRPDDEDLAQEEDALDACAAEASSSTPLDGEMPVDLV